MAYFLWSVREATYISAHGCVCVCVFLCVCVCVCKCHFNEIISICLGCIVRDDSNTTRHNNI